MPGFFPPKLIAALTLGLLLAACGEDPQKMMSSARNYLAKGDVNAATIQLKNVLQKKPELGEARLLFGQILLDSGDVAGAEKELHKALQAGQAKESVIPLLSRAMLSLGKAKEWITELNAIQAAGPAAKAAVNAAISDAYVVDKQPEKAERAAKAALTFDPASVAARISLARIAAIRSDLAGALSQVEAVLVKDPKNYDALTLRADLNLAKGEVDKALADFNTVIGFRPRNAAPRLRKVQILISRSRFEDADVELAQTRKVAPGNLQVRLSEALVALYRNRNEVARDTARQVLRAIPDHVSALIIEGAALFQLKDYVTAQAELERALGKAPRADGARRILARTYLATHDHARALETLKPLLEREKTDQQTLLIAGQAALQAGNFVLSSDYFAKASAGDPKNIGAKTRLGVSRLMGGDIDAGIRELENAATLSPDNSEAVIALTMAHLRRGDISKARAAAEDLVRRIPNKALSLNVLGGVLIQAKDLPGARKAFEKALQVEPGYLPAATNLSRLDVAQGKLEDAKARFQKIIDKDPKSAGAYLGLARLLAQTNAKPEAVKKVLENAITANATALAPRMALIEWLQRTGDKKGAHTVASELAAAFPKDASALALVASVQLQSGEKQQAISTLNSVVQLQPKSPSVLILLADAQRATNDSRGAEDSLRRALKLQPDLVDAYRRLFALKIEAKRIDDAVAVSRELQAYKPKDAQGFFLEGEARAVAKDWSAAARSYTKALELKADAVLASKLHNAQLLSGNKAEAAKISANWIKAHPKDVGFRAYLAEQALVSKDYTEASRIYKSLIEIEPKNALILNNLAWVAGQLKDPKAVLYADRALALAPNSAALLDTKAVLLDASGQTVKALELWHKALSFEPKNGEIRLNLARALIKSGNKSGARSELELLVKSAVPNSPSRHEAENLIKTL